MRRTLPYLLSALTLCGAAHATPNLAPTTRNDVTRVWRTGRGGARQPIIYLHGLGGCPNGGMVRRLVRQFRRQGDRFAIASVGSGQRAVPVNSTKTFSQQLSEARAVLQQAGGKVVLMGHSFGGKAALQLAREYPDKVSCVVAIAPSVNMLYSHWKGISGQRGLPRDLRQLERGLSRHGTQLQRELGQAVQASELLRANGLRSQLNYNRIMRDLVPYDEAALESTVRVPTLLVHGTADRAVSIHYARRFADTNSAAVKLVELPEAGHDLRRLRRGAPPQDMLPQVTPQISRFIHDHTR